MDEDERGPCPRGAARLANDAAQDAFLQAASALHRFDPNRPVEPLLVRIAINRSLDLVRVRVRRRFVSEDSTDEQFGFDEPVAPVAAAIAANVPLAARDRQLTGPPVDTARALGPNGVLFYATFMPANPAEHLPVLLLPLQLGSAQGTGRTRTLHVRVAAYDVTVQITFGAAHPSSSALVAAREELGRLGVPSCPAALGLTAVEAAVANAFVLGWLPAHYGGAPGDIAGATATAAAGARAPRHGQAVLDCGRTVADRSVEVDVTLPKLAKVSASLSELTYFVARTSAGWGGLDASSLRTGAWPRGSFRATLSG